MWDARKRTGHQMTESSCEPSFGRLIGRTAVVTGASSGIGRAIALEFAEAGADVLVHTRARRELAEEVCGQIVSRGRRSCVWVADLSDLGNCEQLVEGAWRWSGDVQIWVNNAGADVLTGPAAELTFAEKLERLWGVDVRGTIHLTRMVGDRMRQAPRAAGDRTILNIGWDQAERGMAGDSGEMFAAVKGAVMAFTRSAARTLAPRVRVNCLAPGWIRTAWGDDASGYWQQRAQRESLLDRWGTPADVAHVARFLVSSSAEFVTGQVVPVNGGFRGSAGE